MEKINTPGRIYFENLDGLRFLAFLLVFISHAALFLGYKNSGALYEWVKSNLLVNGDLGVAFFFVLSGFLITFLLLREQDHTGDISLKKFYLRRILRIWPVYALVVVLGFVVVPAVVQLAGDVSLPFDAIPPTSAWPWYTFFNFSMAMHHVASIPTDILWSVSVEEQFYLVWPWFVLLIPRKHLPKIILLIMLVASVFKCLHAYDPDALAYSTFSVMSDLAVGCLLAWLTVNGSLKKFVSMSPQLIAGLYVGALVLGIGRHGILASLEPYPWAMKCAVIGIPLILAALFAAIIFEQNEASRSLFKIGRIPIVSALGRVSYGLYAYHPAVFALVMSLLGVLGVSLFYSSIVQFVFVSSVLLLSTIMFALVSYYFMERWFLKRKPSSIKNTDAFSL